LLGFSTPVSSPARSKQRISRAVFEDLLGLDACGCFDTSSRSLKARAHPLSSFSSPFFSFSAFGLTPPRLQPSSTLRSTFLTRGLQHVEFLLPRYEPESTFPAFNYCDATFPGSPHPFGTHSSASSFACRTCERNFCRVFAWDHLLLSAPLDEDPIELIFQFSLHIDPPPCSLPDTLQSLSLPCFESPFLQSTLFISFIAGAA